MQEITSHAYDWAEGKDPENGNTVIYCWSLNRDSEPNLLRFHNFDIFCYVELPYFLNNTFVRWEGFREKLIFDAICQKLGDDKPHRYKYVTREKIYFYKGPNKKYPMLLLCFHSVDSMMKCKNALKSAFRVRGLKGGDDQTMVSLRVWETHISPERKLLTLRNCRYSQWFKVKGIKVLGEDKISTLENEYVVDWKTLDPIPSEETVSWITHPKMLSFDLETYSDRHNAMPDSLSSKHVIYLISVVFQKVLEPETRKKEIILLGDCSHTDLANVIKVKSEGELLDVFQDLILKYDPEIITGYNIFGYDNPYLDNRLKRKMREWKPLGRLIGQPSVMKSVSWSSSAYKNQDFNILEMSGRINVDMLPVIKRDFKLPVYKLDYVANYFLGRGKYDVSAKQMFEAYELQKYLHTKDESSLNDSTASPEMRQKALDEMRKVVDYCVVDSDLVVDIFEKVNVWIGLIQMSNIVGVPPEDVFTRGTGIRMISQVYDEASKSGIVMDEVQMPDTDITGGYVFDPTPGIYHNVPCLDFKSLYPNVQISHNMDHTTMLPPDRMDLVPDDQCHVIEWDEDGEEDEETDSEGEDEEKPKKKRVVKKTTHYKYKFIKEPLGIMPRLLKRLIEARNSVRARQKGLNKDSLEWNVLEQTQLGIKISANSFYGACSSSFSKLSLKILGKCITAKARESTKKMNKYLEDKGHKIVYGDSVTGDTPILIQRNGIKEYIEIQDLYELRSSVDNLYDGDSLTNKTYQVPQDVQVWSDLGFTQIKYIMRHKTKKRLFCIVTQSGIVKVTEDHSLIKSDGEEICPKDVKIGDILLTKSHPSIKLGDDEKSSETFSSALECAKWLNGHRKLVKYSYDDGKYVIRPSETAGQPGEITQIIDLGLINDYVYDLETENHHFSAGVGELVVHNTDSTMPDIGITDPKQAKVLGMELAKELSALYPKPMELEHEMTYHTMLCIKKKMYICIILDSKGNPIDDPDKMKIRGVTLARRDNCLFQRNFYKDVVWKVMHEATFLDVFNFIVDKCIQLMCRGAKVEDLVMIKGLGSHYKNKSYMMHIFASEMEKSGNPMVAGDRIQYLIVDGEPDDKVGYKMRTVELYNEKARSENPEHIDYIYYLEKTIRNGIEKQLFQVGYSAQLEELKKHHQSMDVHRFLDAVRSSLYANAPPTSRNILIEGFDRYINQLKADHDEMKVAEIIRDNENMTKISKPLYNYYVNRRLGRRKRLSTRIDKEPILMMVNLFKLKAEVMKSIRQKFAQPSPSKIKLKIVSGK